MLWCVHSSPWSPAVCTCMGNGCPRSRPDARLPSHRPPARASALRARRSPYGAKVVLRRTYCFKNNHTIISYATRSGSASGERRPCAAARPARDRQETERRRAEPSRFALFSGLRALGRHPLFIRSRPGCNASTHDSDTCNPHLIIISLHSCMCMRPHIHWSMLRTLWSRLSTSFSLFLYLKVLASYHFSLTYPQGVRCWLTPHCCTCSVSKHPA